MSGPKQKIFIGVAWPYANGPLHLGHFAGSLIPPDIFARYHRMRGNDVLMVSGSDQHGTPITLNAMKTGRTPQDVADEFHRINKKCIEDMGITFDLFTKTADPAHKDVVTSVFQQIKDNGYLYEKDSVGLYCSACSKFLPDRYVNGTCPHCSYNDARGDQCDECGKTLDAQELKDPRCNICNGTPGPKDTRHVFFKLSAFQEKLIEWIGEQKHWKNLVKGFTKQWFTEGLKDRAITRDLEWGVDVPMDGYDGKKIYVWFEAVIGYLSASKQWAKNTGNKWEDFWKSNDARHYYFLGKDNIPFHTVIWPAMLMAHGGLTLPYDVPANAYLTLSGLQFSKSRNHAVWVPEYLKRYDPDILRYYLSINMPENRDNDFTWEQFVEKNNGDLVGTIGNFIHRNLTFYKKNYGEIRPRAFDPAVTEIIDNAYAAVSENIEKCRFQEAAKSMLHLATAGNKYFADKAPWALVKEDRDACEDALYNSLRIAWALSFLMYPFMPSSAEKVVRLLGRKGIDKMNWDTALTIPKDVSFGNIAPLFGKLDLKAILEAESCAEEKKGDPMTAESLNKNEKKDSGLIDIGHFGKLDLRVGEILEVSDHPKADKLYVVKVKVGDEVRQLVAGLKAYYSPEDMVGKRVIIVANLEPAKLRGVESQGMLLAADDGEKSVSMLTLDRELPTGSRVR